MKGITPVIAVILLLLITISMVGFSMVFFQRTVETATKSGDEQLAQQLDQIGSQPRIESAAGSKVVIRNMGSVALTVSNLVFSADGETKTSSGPASLGPGAVGEYTVQDFVAESVTVLRVSSAGFADTKRVMPRSCRGITALGQSTGSGIYTIYPLDTRISAYCDMTSDGGSWTLVLLNSQYSTPPKPTWIQAVNDNNVQGNMTSGLGGFDQIVGLKYWNTIGGTMKLEMGSNPTSLSHKATYTYSLNEGNNYALSMSNENVLLTGTGTASSGMYTYHATNNYQFTTYDADHGIGGGNNCATYYSNTAWWYGECWSGSFWGGGDADGYSNEPYWTGSGMEHFPWGAVWIR